MYPFFLDYQALYGSFDHGSSVQGRTVARTNWQDCLYHFNQHFAC